MAERLGIWLPTRTQGFESLCPLCSFAGAARRSSTWLPSTRRGFDSPHLLYELVRWRGNGSAKSVSRVQFPPSSPGSTPSSWRIPGGGFLNRLLAGPTPAEGASRFALLSVVTELRSTLRTSMSRFNSERRGHRHRHRHRPIGHRPSPVPLVHADRGSSLRSSLSVFNSRRGGHASVAAEPRSALRTPMAWSDSKRRRLWRRG
jgi:hypothetical protein